MTSQEWAFECAAWFSAGMIVLMIVSILAPGCVMVEKGALQIGPDHWPGEPPSCARPQNGPTASQPTAEQAWPWEQPNGLTDFLESLK